ncbi:MAG: chitobiase/beta-hexosaminidase C-terminal domain-containing protein, partial [Planctomycetota bacterium]|nr:chitobiase/beta-hexosaminidase C-terminal domain-containing protein [Planctomycetota bacterium]
MAQTVAPPVITPAGSTNLPVTVSISCATPGAVLRYTLNGTTPNATSTLYTNLIALTNATWVRARGFASNGSTSTVRSAYFNQTVTVPTPTLGMKVLTNTPWLPQVQIGV